MPYKVAADKKRWVKNNPERMAAYHHKWYQQHRTEQLAYTRRFHQANRQFITEQKAVPCVDCDVQYPSYVMDFDHVRGEKLFDVSQMMDKTREEILAEIQKCDVVCANCHRIRTHKRVV